LKDSLLQESQTGVYFNLPAYTLTLNNVKKCNVTTPITGPGCPPTCYYYGSFNSPDDCGPLYTVGSFAGVKMQGESGNNIPDTMGAVGPKHFMVMLNGDKPVAVYDKFTGAKKTPNPNTTTLNQFFAVTVSSGPYAGSYPTGSPFDPRVVYDHGSQRWIACAIDSGSHHVLLAFSNGNDPVGAGGTSWVSSNWTKYIVPMSSSDTDYDTLGVDSNGIYICVQDIANAIVKVAALPKAPFVAGTAQTVQENFILQVTNFGTPAIQPAVNFDSITSSDPALFIWAGGNSLYYNRLKWVNGLNSAPQWQDNELSWPSLAVTTSFYDLVLGGITAPQLNSTKRVSLGHQGSRSMMATTRKIGGTQYLWTCRQIGVNSSGNNNTTADRSGIEWFKIQVTPSVTISTTGRIYDGSGTPKFYYMPSLAVNKNGDMVLGFSGSSANDYIGAYHHNGLSANAPVRYFAGKEAFLAPGNFIWGDYSYTTLDPDGFTMWTIQEYTETRYDFGGFVPNAWGTRVGAVSPY
ncbi:MAG: hypothetical protein MN733_40205, partial [Nitrososphaera sp.]|nr:hypothetical protein [Nitrososphaera sp.]